MCCAIEPQVVHRLAAEMDAQPGGVAVAGGKLGGRGQRIQGEPVRRIGTHALCEGLVEDGFHTVGAQVAVAGAVSSCMG